MITPASSPIHGHIFARMTLWLCRNGGAGLAWCSVPDDYIDKRRFPLFFARDVLQALVAELKAENAVAPERSRGAHKTC